MKISHYLLLACALLYGTVNSQGVINNDCFINVSSGAFFVIEGADGNYLATGGAAVFNATGLGGEIHVGGNWTNNATASGFGNDGLIVRMKGGNQLIGGSASTMFYTLFLEGTGTKTLGINTYVGGIMNLDGVLHVGARILDLNSRTLFIRNSAVGAVTSTSGYIVSETNLAVNPSKITWDMAGVNGNFIFPFGVAGTRIPLNFQKTAGNASVTISTRATASSNNIPWAGASNVGAVTTMGSALLGIADASIPSVIDRWWDITPSAAVTADVTFRYRLSENTTSYMPEDFGAQHWTGSQWESPVGSGTTDGVVGQVLAAGLSNFSPYVLAPIIYPLPTTLEQMNVDCDEAGNSLYAKIVRHSAVSHYVLEQSRDGVNWQNIQTWYPKGSVGVGANYFYQTNQGGKIYYRLLEVYFDGNSVELDVVYSKCDDVNKLNIHPNPSNGIFQIVVESVQNRGEKQFVITDVQGQIVYQQDALINSGTSKLNIELDLPSGVYLLHILDQEIYETQKIVIKN